MQSLELPKNIKKMNWPWKQTQGEPQTELGIWHLQFIL